MLELSLEFMCCLRAYRSGKDRTGSAGLLARGLKVVGVMWVWLFGVGGGEAGAVDFQRDVLPILSDNCFACHGPDEAKRKADLRLDLKGSAAVGKNGKGAIVPGESGRSELYRRVRSDDPEEVMPPPKSNRRLTPGQVEVLRGWIDEGARWSEHWAFESLVWPELPGAGRWEDRVVNEIDSFVFARLEREGLEPSPEAERETLIRRVTLDLTGLPPAPGEVEDFVGDDGPEAYDRLVERLLGSPSFGERMAWDWLDAARYADSNGYQGDSERTMWPWRDWVVEAFNSNLGYDEFTRWQLAGDLMTNGSFEQKLATGFCRNHMINGEGGRIAEENRVDYVMDMLETTGTVWLGLTFNCCRCHDHKFDPLTRRDYYSFFAFFNQTPVTGEGGNPQTKPVLEVPTHEQKAALVRVEQEVGSGAEALEEYERSFSGVAEGDGVGEVSEKIRKILGTAVAKRGEEQLGDLVKEFQETKPEFAAVVKGYREARETRSRIRRATAQTMVMEDMEVSRKTYMLEKGSYEKRQEEVTAEVPAKLPRLRDGAARNRLGLAEWLVAPENPLTARVTVNRFWQQFFGVGLVKTPENLGVQGEFPMHPELLDWLAAEFMRTGWDVKGLCRLMVRSGTYRQSSKAARELLERDPENRLLARGARFRMPSWMVRDQALAAAGLLVGKVGGAPVRSYQPTGVWEEATFGNKKYEMDHGERLYRRSLYVFWRRIVGPTAFFDSAARQTCSVKQPRTNTPLHALTTLNDVTYVEAARALAERVLLEAGPSVDEKLELAFRLVLARGPREAEREVLRASLERLKEEFGRDRESAVKILRVGESEADAGLDEVEHAAYTGVCSAILNLDEALTRE